MQIIMFSPGGKPKGAEKTLFEGYAKRIDRSFKFELDASEQVKLLSGKIKLTDYVILLDEHGQQFDNLSFAGRLNGIISSGSAKRIVFVMGDSYGSSKELKKRADLVWSFSEQVFPHQLFRVMLIEQIYRSLEIIKGSPYHHL